MSLYNLKTDGDHYRITKFTNDLEVESSYLCSETECECPAGHRPTCRHRQMLPELLANNALDRAVFFDFDTRQFYQSAETSDFDSPSDKIESQTLTEDEISQLPDGVEKDNAQTTEDPTPSGPASEPAASQNTAEREPMSDPAQSEAGTPHPTIGKIERRI